VSVTRRAFTAGALALASAPFAARAQAPGKVNRVALVSVGLAAADMVEGGSQTHSAFLVELRRLGYVEGQNLIVERHSGRDRADPYGSLARTVVESQPEVIVTSATPLVAALKGLTTTIPIVANVNDPVASGLVASLARPGGNITAFTVDAGPELNGKALQLLKNAIPAASHVAYLDLRAMWELPGAATSRASAQGLGVTLVPVLLNNPVTEASYRDAFSAIAREQVDALYVGPTNENYSNLGLIADLALTARLPSACLDPRFSRSGGLLSYGPDLRASWRGIAGYVDRILKGAKPADLPVQLPTVFEFIVNLKTAKALGITLPESIMVSATEVIE
jgi:putative tryptophan/tyrosine transport system substrate-binding protein